MGTIQAMPESTQGSLVDVLVDYVRILLGVDQATVIEWRADARTFQVLAASGSLTHTEVVPGDPIDAAVYGLTTAPRSAPSTVSVGDGPSGMVAFLERVGARHHLSVPVFDGPGDGWILEALRVDDVAFGDAELAAATMLAPLAVTAIRAEHSERYFRAVTERARDAVVVLDAEGRMLYRNPSAGSVLGWRNEDLGSISSFELIHAADVDTVRAAFAEIVADPSRRPVVKVRVQRREGGWSHVEAALTNLTDDPAVGGIVVNYRDVTEAVEAAARLRESERLRRELLLSLLSAEQQERARLAGDLHDDTLQVMIAAQYRMQMVGHELTREGHPRAELVTRTGADLGQAIGRARLLMFELDPPDMAPGGLAAALSALAGVEASEGGFAVEVEVTTGDLPDATRRLCYRTVREALTNVRRHAKAAHVNVRVERANGYVTGVITDDGDGFDIAVLHSDGRRLHLGLRALGARIEQTGGTWRIDSTPGQGSTLVFEVPVHGA